MVQELTMIYINGDMSDKSGLSRPFSNYESKLLVSGSRDKTVNIRSPDNHHSIRTLKVR